MPAIALRGMSIMPGMIAHFDISRDRSLKAVEESMQADQKIFLVTQRDVDVEEPMQSDLYEMGIVAEIKQVVKLQNDVVRLNQSCRYSDGMESFKDSISAASSSDR